MTERSETEAEPRQRVRLLVAYDGTDFHGFAENTGVVTVGGTLRAAIERVLGTGVELTVAGRTDAGVHAWGQVVTFDAPAAGLDLDRLQRSVNGLCKPAIVVRAAEPAPAGLRRPLLGDVAPVPLHGPEPDGARPVPGPHVVAGAPSRSTWPSLRLACDPLIGEHDFTSFCRAPAVPDRRAAAHARAPGDGRRRGRDLGDGVLRFEIRANAFCHQMVRSLVGLLVDVGRGRRRAGDVLRVLRARDRRGLGNIAPPTGLCLWEVGYPDGFGRRLGRSLRRSVGGPAPDDERRPSRGQARGPPCAGELLHDGRSERGCGWTTVHELPRSMTMAGALAAGAAGPGRLGRRAGRRPAPTSRSCRRCRDPPKIICVGLNYADHAAETGAQIPDYPVLFPRFTTTLVADGDPLLVPHGVGAARLRGRAGGGDRRRRAQHPPRPGPRARGRLLDLQRRRRCATTSARTSQFLPGKNFDGTGGFGPEIVTADELPPGATGLRLTTTVAGEVLQDSNTKQLIFDVAHLVEAISGILTLEPGDLIVTGTPNGVGAARKPPRWLVPGEAVEVTIEGIGTLRNPVAAGL